VTQRTLQLDNHFSSESLCFVVSKTDSSLSISRYIKTHPNVEEALSDEFAKEERYNLMLDQVNEYCAGRRGTQYKSKVLYDKLNKEFKQLPQKGKNLKASRPKKRKLDELDELSGMSPTSHYSNHLLITLQLASIQPPSEEEKKAQKKASALWKRVQQAKAKMDSAGSDLFRGQEKIMQLENSIKDLQSRQKAACIKNRNEVSTSELRQDYQNVSKQLGQRNKKPLQVFCVSALAFSDMAKGSTNVEGFLKLSDTGIPLLQKWLVETTLRDRERYAVAFLEDDVSLELSMAPWIADTSAEFKMPQTQREIVEDIFDKNFDSLLKV